MKKYIYGIILAAGLGAVFLTMRPNTPEKIMPFESWVSNTEKTNVRPTSSFANQNKGNVPRENNGQTAPKIECLGPCLGRILSALISGDTLTNLEKRLVNSDSEFLAHYLKYNPQHMIDAALFTAAHTSKDLDDSEYDESLEDRVAMLDSIISRLPIDELTRIASTLVYSGVKSERLAGLTLIERAYIDRKEAEMRGKEAAITDVLRNIALTDTDPDLQLQAIDILSYEDTEEVNEDTILILTNLATGNHSAKTKGRALKMAAYFAKPDSAIISQISVELNNSASQIQLPALRALQTLYSRSSADDTQMRARLLNLKPALEAYMQRESTYDEAQELAGNIYKSHFQESQN